MKTLAQARQDVVNLLEVPELLTQITGRVYQTRRPAGRKKLDIVVGALGLDTDMFQQGTFNVKIHAPNISVTTDGVTDANTPNIPEMDRIMAIGVELLDNKWKNSFRTEVATMYEPQQDSDLTWFSRVVVDYESYNKEFKNI
jgi:hypothetical protein